jgi:hypothetical protein
LVGSGLVTAALDRMAKGFHRTDSSIARDGDLARGQQSFGDLALRALEQFIDLGWIEANFARMLGNLMR